MVTCFFFPRLAAFWTIDCERTEMRVDLVSFEIKQRLSSFLFETFISRMFRLSGSRWRVV